MIDYIEMKKNKAKKPAGIARTRGKPFPAYISAKDRTGSNGMKLFENNWDYIMATAAAKAVEIARHAGRMSDVEDFTQDVLFYFVSHADQYDPKRSQPKTFINMILTYAKKDLLRRMYRMKRRAGIKTIELHQTEAESIIDDCSTAAEDIADFIEALQEPERTLCRQVIVQGISAGIVARKQGKSKDEILSLIREAMRPVAKQIGIRAARESDGRPTEPPSKPGTPQVGREGRGASVGSSDNPFRSRLRGK